MFNRLLGKLVKHKNKLCVALVLKKSIMHDGYYFVFVNGRLKEWHISNISERI